MLNAKKADDNLVVISQFRKSASLLAYGVADLFFLILALILFYYLINNGFRDYYGWALFPGLAGSVFFLTKCLKVTKNILFDHPMIFIKGGRFIAYDRSMTNIRVQDLRNIVSDGNSITIYCGSGSKKIGVGLGTETSDKIAQFYNENLK